MAPTTAYTADEVAKHSSDKDCWIIVHGKVFNVTGFLGEHPGGKKVLLKVAGKDASKQFDQFHNQAIMDRYFDQLCIGVVGSGSAAASGASGAGAAQAVVAAAPPKKKAAAPAGAAAAAAAGRLLPAGSLFGDIQVPMADPGWYQGLNSPFYNESHKRLRKWMRHFVDTELMPFAHDWDESGNPVPRRVFERCGETGILAAFDSFHEFIVMDELARVASGGVLWGLMGGHTIALPPVVHFGSDFVKNKVVADCLSGKKIVCLAITEPSGGSDVANLKTEARLTPDGKHFIVNGEKKWITNAIYADFFVVAVRTGGAGMGGISLLLLEKGMPGIVTRKMKCSGVWSSGTTYMAFEDVKVPVENLVGPLNGGFKCIMYNFNHERMGIAIQANRFARVCLSEALAYAQKRETFGKKLIEHGVIRNKLGHMARKVEATHAWIEMLIYQFQTLPREIAQARLGGATALLKAQSTQTMEFCAREAAQIFGGLSFTRGGQGEKVERLYREVRAYAIPGGSEEIMLDLGVRQSLKVAEMLKMAAKL
ncbi:acyl-CoA dehydrogenase/oxidase [Entophlyctis helioformis]|nr:acyl-CoA dehydrogenase/oxidase [Entophlyctis helioformis]